ncbi:MAG TPA: hypothetical protein VF148_04995 [Acidimicrobiia bacterium]
MSVGHATPHAAAFPAAVRLVVAVAALIVVGSGLTAGSDSSPRYGSADRVSEEANQMMATIEALSESLAAHESPEMVMAWEDLRSDLESVSRDLESARFSVDVDGLVERVRIFREEFASVEGVTENAEVWDRLTNHLKELASHSR